MTGQKYELIITASGLVTSTDGEPVPDNSAPSEQEEIQ